MPAETESTRRRGERGYAVCTSGRSGSNLLCQYLASTGVLGRPLEFFNAAARRMFGFPDYPEEPDKQIEWALTAGATANGVYGVKVFPAQIDRIGASIPWSRMLPNLAFAFLRRRDVLGQAISNLRATQTQQWRSTMTPQGVATYDGDRIYVHLRDAVREYARWDAFFARNAIAPTTIWYEGMLVDPQAAVDKIAAVFGLAGQAPIAPADVDLRMQRDALNAEWRARFHAEFRDLDEIDSI
jgi:LPS sulfotransferase NodH